MPAVAAEVLGSTQWSWCSQLQEDLFDSHFQKVRAGKGLVSNGSSQNATSRAFFVDKYWQRKIRENSCELTKTLPISKKMQELKIAKQAYFLADLASREYAGSSMRVDRASIKVSARNV